MKQFNLITIVLLGLLSCKQEVKEQKNANKIEYAMSMVFRETPYADIRAARVVSENEVQNKTHFELKYDNYDRLIEVKYLLNGKQRPYSDRFVRSPFIKIEYVGNKEIRTYYNQYGHRTLVSGDVYEVRIALNNEGEREDLKFYNIEGKHIESDFGIATYKWKRISKNKVIEYRYDINNKIVRNRPGFGYLITEFIYNKDGLLDKMVNLGLKGNHPEPDQAGVVSTKIGYDQYGQFTQWLNLDKHDKPIKGMSAIAEIRYTPSLFRGEQEAKFIDKDGNPQTTRWGAHKVVYEFDKFGNETSRFFFGIDNNQINVNNGVSEIRSEWTEDGMYRISRKYFNKEGKPTGIGKNKIHEYRTKVDEKLSSISTYSYNLSGDLVLDDYTGFAIDSFLFDSKGRLVERKFLNKKNESTNHNTWKVSRFKYVYINDMDLKEVITYDKEGNIVKPQWNPNH